MTTIKHKHHIIPKHAGGSDDPSNLVELTIEEHAEAHRLLFLEHGRWQDELAWKGLAGLIGHDELIDEMYRQSGLNNIKYLLSATTRETCSRGGKAGLATLIQRNPEHQRKAGLIACKNPNTVAALTELRADPRHQSKAGKEGGKKGKGKVIVRVLTTGLSCKVTTSEYYANRDLYEVLNTCKGKRWFTDGEVSVLKVECPEGFRAGRHSRSNR